MTKLKTLEDLLPIEVRKINNSGSEGRRGYRADRIGSWVAVRSCAEEDGSKTYLGVYLGDLQLSSSVSWDRKSKELSVLPWCNPAMWVPDLKKIVWGCGSWWGIIKTPEDLKQITDADISNVWYVRAAKELAELDKQEASK